MTTIRGSQKLAVLLAKFSDTAAEPRDRAFFEDLFVGRGTGGLNDYWPAATLGAVNLDGTEVFGWKNLGGNRADFVAGNPTRAGKIDAAVEAFGIKRGDYAGVVALFADGVGDAGAAGGVLGGPTEMNLTFLAHEIGHLFGIEHSFDTSDRRLETWSQAGEYYDRHDLMSAMNVNADSGHRFSPRGPLLNAANMIRMGWMPPERVFRPQSLTSSARFDIEIFALGSDPGRGHLAADFGTAIAEFRINDGFDAGLPRPAVLIHAPADPNSVIYASDPKRHVHEWLPGQTYDATTRLLGQTGGLRISVLGFDLARRAARLEAQVLAVRPPFRRSEDAVALGPNGTLVRFVNGRIVVEPIPDPRLVLLGPRGRFAAGRGAAALASPRLRGLAAPRAPRLPAGTNGRGL